MVFPAKQKSRFIQSQGGDTFCFLELNRARNGLVMVVSGDYQLTDVIVAVIDYTKPHEEDVERPRVPPRHTWPYRYDLVNGDREDFGGGLVAMNGFWSETLRLG